MSEYEESGEELSMCTVVQQYVVSLESVGLLLLSCVFLPQRPQLDGPVV